MPDDKRFILFDGSDGPLNARDRVIHHIAEWIDSNLREDEPAFLNYAAAFIRSLIAVARDLGGIELVQEKIKAWEVQALRTFDAMEPTSEEIAKDRPFLVSLFQELQRLADAADSPV